MLAFQILRGREVVDATLEEWTAWGTTVTDEERRVGYDDLGDREVSTVFLYATASPGMHFETAVLYRTGSRRVDVRARCATWTEAERQHARVVAEEKSKCDTSGRA